MLRRREGEVDDSGGKGRLERVVMHRPPGGGESDSDEEEDDGQ